MRYTGGVRFVKTRGLSQNGKARNGMEVNIAQKKYFGFLVANAGLIWLVIWLTKKITAVIY